MKPIKSLSLLLIMLLPFIIGSSKQLPPENNPFTLTNHTTFSPGTMVTVNLYSYNNTGSEFRLALLKITDPLSFFAGLSSSYSFDIWGKDKEILLRYTEKVKEWNDFVKGDYAYEKGNVTIGKIEEPGMYIVQAIKGDQVAYCAVVVSDMAIVYKNSSSQVLAFLTNVKTSEFIKDVKFTLVYNKVTSSLFSDKDGLALFNIKETKGRQDIESRPLLIAQTGKETLISNPYFYFGRSGANLLTAYVYTNQPVYRPGQIVYFKAILRDKVGNDLKNIAGTDFSVSIKSPRNKEIYSEVIKTNDLGTISGYLSLEEKADLGNYSILISKGEANYYGSFEVQEYKKPEYQVKIELPKTNYANKDELTGKVKADYYFGSPVKNGTVALKIYKKYYWRPWWYWSDYSWFYRSFDKISPYNWRELTFVQQMDGVLNSKGEYDFNYKVNEEYNADYVYVISAEVTDASRRAVTGNTNIFITRGSFSIFTTPDKYFTETGKPVVLKINASDFNEHPVETDYKIVIQYPSDSPDRYGNIKEFEKDSIIGRTDKGGKSIISYYPKNLKAGYYHYLITAKDEKGREITAQSSFYYGQNYYYSYNGQGVEIVTDKDSYEKGDSLTAYIFLPSPGTELLLTYESNNIFYYKKITAKEKSIVIKEKLGDKFAPSFNISVAFMKDGKFYNNTKQVGVLAKDKFLSISILPDKKGYKPGDNANYKVIVKDYKGNPVKNTELSFGVIDESIYAIKEDAVPDIKSFFYAPQYSYIPAYNSYLYVQSTGQSRVLTAIDKDYFDKGLIEQKGNGRLYGKIKNREGKTFAGIKLILNSNNNYYITTTDSTGSYEFNKIKQGDYSLFYFNPGSSIVLIDKVAVGKEKKFDAAIDLPSEQMFGGQQSGVVFRGGREGGVDFSLMDKSSPQMMELSTTSAKVNYQEAVVRSNFVDAAYWIPDVRTNDFGIAEVKFKMPDNLTTWRASVKGVTVKTDVGQEINKTITRKDLLIRMETPRFFREGDEITISTIVHNYLNEQKRTKISFKADNLTLIRSDINTPGYSTNMYNRKDGLYELSIDKNTELRIDWVVKVDIPLGEAKINAEALTNSESDALQLKVPIIPKGIKELKSVIAELSDKQEENIQFNIPKDVDLRSAKFSFAVSPTLAATILKALDDLAGYPYGCVEQTMSRFLPTIIAANTFKDLNIPLKSNTLTQMPDMVNAGLDRLYSFQHPDGGWGWWTNDNTHPYMTAYVIYGMNLARKAGYKIDQNVYRNGLENLNTQINGNIPDPTTLSFMLYALSSSNDPKYTPLILAKIREMELSKLNSYSISLNIISLVNINEKGLESEYVNKLISMSDSKAGMVFWSGKEWHYNWQDDIVQSTSFAVKAMIKSGSKSELISKAVNWLITQKQGYSWRSTQETAAVIFALSDYLKTTNELNPDYTYSIYLNNKKIVTKKIGLGDVYKQPEEININGITDKNLMNGDNNIRIIKEGSGKLYFSGLNQYYISSQSSSNKDNNFNVRREYYLLKPEQDGDRIIYKKNVFDGELKSGDELLVKTFVDSRTENLQYFILEDMLPSGFEPIKEENKYEIEGENDYHVFYNDFRRIRPWRWFYADKEYRDQKVSFFVTNVNRQMEFSYLIKAQIPGTVTVSPAQAYLMYYPEVNGNSEWLEIKTQDK
jgi:alpha-2-macroglobulin